MASRRGGAAEAVEGGVGGVVEVPDASGVNEVRLAGRLSGDPEARELPSGDEVVQLRVVVRRPPDAARGATGGSAKTTVDTIDVTCWTPVTRRAALRLADGDPVEVEGSLRRRFYRSGAAVQSRYDVVAASLRRARRPARS